MSGGQLPTGLWMDAQLNVLTSRALPFYFLQKGNHGSGLVLVKVNGLQGRAKVFIQERNFMEDRLEWMNPFEGQESVEEKEADAYIQRAIQRDPDLWAIEVECETMNNPLADAGP